MSGRPVVNNGLVFIDEVRIVGEFWLPALGRAFLATRICYQALRRRRLRFWSCLRGGRLLIADFPMIRKPRGSTRGLLGAALFLIGQLGFVEGRLLVGEVERQNFVRLNIGLFVG